MISYEQTLAEGAKRWVTAENIQGYLSKVTKMVDMSSKFNGRAIYAAATREEELRSRWYKNMKVSGYTFDLAILETVKSSEWMSERDLELAATEFQSIPRPSGEFDTPRPAHTSYTMYQSFPRPHWKDHGERIPGSRHDRRWSNMRHTLCMNHQHGRCQYTAQECNRAHGPEYLEKPAYNDDYKFQRKGEDKGGKGKNNSSRHQPYPADKGKGKGKDKGKGKSK